MFNIKFDDDGIRTVDLWRRKKPLYQLSHSHCSLCSNFFGLAFKNAVIFVLLQRHLLG